MKSRDLREMSAAALTDALRVAQVELATLSEAIASGKEKNHAALKGKRLDIARIKTIIRESL